MAEKIEIGAGGIESGALRILYRADLRMFLVRRAPRTKPIVFPALDAKEFPDTILPVKRKKFLISDAGLVRPAADCRPVFHENCAGRLF